MRKAFLAAVLGVVCVLASLVWSGPATGAPATPHVTLSLRGDAGAISGGRSSYLRSDVDETIVNSMSTSRIVFSISDHTNRDDWTVAFTRDPAAAPFRVGEYGSTAYTQAHGIRAGVVDVLVAGGGRGCDQEGAARITDIATSGKSITRLDLAFVVHCDGEAPAAFGDVQVNEPNQNGSTVELSDRTVLWPDTDPRAVATLTPVTAVNAGTQTTYVGRGVITGSGRQSFRIVGEGCGENLSAGDGCTTTVQFLPGDRGTSTATLVRDVGGYPTSTALVGPAADGSTGLDLDGAIFTSSGVYDRHNTVVHSTLVPENAGIRTNGGAQQLTFDANGGLLDWDVKVLAAKGKTLALGTHKLGRSDSADYAVVITGADYSGHNSYALGCGDSPGTISITQMVKDPATGEIARFDAAFAEHCGGAHPFTGRIRINATAPDIAPILVDAPAHPIHLGARVTIVGHATPNSTVVVSSRRRGSSHYSTLLRTTARPDGAFEATYRAVDDVSIAATQPTSRNAGSTVRSSARSYLIAPTLDQSGTLYAEPGRGVTLSGSANPHRTLTIVTISGAGAASTSHTVHVTRAGRWTTTVTPRRVVRVHAISSTHTTSATVIVHPAEAR